MHGLAGILAKNYEVYVVDVPGFGESERPDSAWSLEEYSQWLREFLGKIKIPKLYGLIGHSNGGAIAVKSVAGGLPVEHLVLLGASGVRNRERGKKLFLNSIAKTGKVATRVLPKKTRQKIRNRWYDKIGSELYAHKGMEASFKKVVAEDLLIEAAMISAPTLLIYGTEDKATPPLYGHMYASVIEQSQFHSIESAGHYVFLDAPKDVTELIENFLK
jgi:pimeloyl-ACP methyl ester carboxylesterase